ncbi:hypothetical protein AB6A40_002146 [Gnathostoma spinigerum]|uniref:Uncharacterized protein n=1 Tax=Gnathostoma spinigerum TaxID=75299 RepID=A0ABD6EFI4_9BILA
MRGQLFIAVLLNSYCHQLISDGYGAPPRLDQLSSAKSTYSAYDISSLKSSGNNVIPAGGFMTMTGTDIYHSPARVPQRSNVETGSQSVANVVETFSRLNMPPNNVNDVSTTKTASNGEIPYRSSLMSTMGSPQKKPSHEPFSRANINRVSLTKRFFNNSSAVIEKPRTVWNPPSMAVRRTTSSMHYWSPMSPSASAIVRRKSTNTDNRCWHCPPRVSAVTTAMSTSCSSSLSLFGRPLTLHAIKNRRLTLASTDELTNNINTDLSTEGSDTETHAYSIF